MVKIFGQISAEIYKTFFKGVKTGQMTGLFQHEALNRVPIAKLNQAKRQFIFQNISGVQL